MDEKHMSDEDRAQADRARQDKSQADQGQPAESGLTQEEPGQRQPDRSGPEHSLVNSSQPTKTEPMQDGAPSSRPARDERSPNGSGQAQPLQRESEQGQSDQGHAGDPEAGRTQPPDAAKAKPKPKKGKPSFDEFLLDLTDTIKGPSKKDDLPVVMRLLRKGYDGEVQPDHAEKVFDVIKTYSSADRLIVQLTTALPKRPSAIARTVRNRLRLWIEDAIRYPDATPGSDRLFELADWVKTGDRKPKDPEAHRYPDDWIRMAFACLAAEPDLAIRCAAVHRLLEVVARLGNQKAKGAFRTDGTTFLREAGKLISSRTISAGRVAASLQFGYPLEEASRRDRVALSRAREEAAEAEEKSRTLAEKNERLRQQLDDAMNKADSTQRELDETRSELTVQVDRMKDLEHHWETTSEQKLARLRHQVATDLGHDLQEARLALDRDSPNVEMGLNRIRKAETVIRALDT